MTGSRKSAFKTRYGWLVVFIKIQTAYNRPPLKSGTMLRSLMGWIHGIIVLTCSIYYTIIPGHTWGRGTSSQIGGYSSIATQVDNFHHLNIQYYKFKHSPAIAAVEWKPRKCLWMKAASFYIEKFPIRVLSILRLCHFALFHLLL